ncbi:hypothetical protein [Flavisphingomonas formosensis]|nr:hypothetical protein [Sphingomonas formosensis]
MRGERRPAALAMIESWRSQQRLPTDRQAPFASRPSVKTRLRHG